MALQLSPAPIRQSIIEPGSQNLPQHAWILWFQTVYKTLIALPTGIQTATQATLPAGLTVDDAGLLIDVTDYGHILKWTGTGWTWGAGDAGSGMVEAFLSAPSGPGWHICDGSTVSRLNADGTLSSVALPDYTTAAYLKLGTTEVVGPTPGGGSTSAVSAGTPAGTNSAPAFTGTPDTTGINDAATGVPQGAGAPVVVAADGHQHPITPSGTVSAPGFTGTALAPHSHSAGTIDLRNTQLLAYFRR